MKQIFSLLIFSFFSLDLQAETPAINSKKSAALIEVIVSGSGCPQKQSKPIQLNIESDQVQVPIDFEIELSGANLVRKTCQARITINGTPNFHYEVREVSQNMLFNVQKKSNMHAEISFGILGQQDFKIDQDVKEVGEYRHILLKKLINYSTPCGKNSVLRIQTDVRSSGGGKNNFKAEPVALRLEKSACEMPPTN